MCVHAYLRLCVRVRAYLRLCVCSCLTSSCVSCAANLKRSSLLLYECDEQSALPELETVHSDMKLGMHKQSQDQQQTKTLIIYFQSVLSDLENSLAHAVHDYVKRDNLLCLSTSSGNTYYMQV